MPRWVGRAWRMVTWSRWSGNSEIAAAEETLGGLDGFSGQRLLTRHFVDDALEAEYQALLFRSASRTMRYLLLFMLAIYALLIVASLAGWSSLSPAGTSIAQFWLPAVVLLPIVAFVHSKRYTEREALPWWFGVLAVSVMLLHVVPTFFFDQPHSTATYLAPDDCSAERLEAAQFAAWYVSKSVFYMLVVVLYSPQLRVSVATFLTNAALYHAKTTREWDRAPSVDISKLTPNLLMCLLGSLLIMTLVDHVKRRQFVLFTLLERATSARIEQLAREKERLEYERAFAVQRGDQLAQADGQAGAQASGGSADGGSANGASAADEPFQYGSAAPAAVGGAEPPHVALSVGPPRVAAVAASAGRGSSCRSGSQSSRGVPSSYGSCSELSFDEQNGGGAGAELGGGGSFSSSVSSMRRGGGTFRKHCGDGAKPELGGGDTVSSTGGPQRPGALGAREHGRCGPPVFDDMQTPPPVYPAYARRPDFVKESPSKPGVVFDASSRDFDLLDGLALCRLRLGVDATSGELLDVEGRPLDQSTCERVEPGGAPRADSAPADSVRAERTERCDMAIFVMDAAGDVYYTFDWRRPRFHHTSLCAGAPVACAGEMRVASGRIVAINNRSGHYRTPASSLHSFVLRLVALGATVPRDAVHEWAGEDGLDGADHV